MRPPAGSGISRQPAVSDRIADHQSGGEFVDDKRRSCCRDLRTVLVAVRTRNPLRFQWPIFGTRFHEFRELRRNSRKDRCVIAPLAGPTSPMPCCGCQQTAERTMTRPGQSASDHSSVTPCSLRSRPRRCAVGASAPSLDRSCARCAGKGMVGAEKRRFRPTHFPKRGHR